MSIASIFSKMLDSLTDEELALMRKQKPPQIDLVAVDGESAAGKVTHDEFTNNLEMTSSINDNNNNNFLYEDEETLIEGDELHFGDTTESEVGSGYADSTFDGSNDVDIDHLKGDDLYWTNSKSSYKSALIRGQFSIADFEIDLTKYTDKHGRKHKWIINPEDATEECQGGVTARFDDYFGKFASSIFPVLADLFPYEVPDSVLLQVSTAFICKYPTLATFFFAYQEKYPTSPFAKCHSPVNLLQSKLVNKFKYRGDKLKQRLLWPYRPHQIDLNVAKGGKKPKEINFDFEYSRFKDPLMKRMADKRKFKEEEEANKKKAPRPVKKLKVTMSTNTL